MSKKKHNLKVGDSVIVKPGVKDPDTGGDIGGWQGTVTGFAEMALAEVWEEHLEENLSFPFEAEVAEYQEREPLRAGDRVKVKSILDADDHYGITVDIRRGREQFAFPLCDLEVTDRQSANYQIVKDYAIWFANR